MSILDNLMDSIEHPLRNWKQYIILSVLFVIVHFLYSTILFEPYNAIFFIIGLIIEIVIFGYFFSVVLETMRNTDLIPQFSILENLIDGIKYFILAFIYSLIPLIILFSLFSASGNPNPLWMIINLITPNTLLMGLITGEFIETFIFAIISSKYVTTYAIIFLLGFIFSYPFFMSLSRVIATGKILEGFKFKKIFKIYGEIGFANYTRWFVMFYIYSVIFIGLWALISLIIGGEYIAYFIIAPFMILFIGRSLGLLYKNGVKYTNSNRPQPKKVNKEAILHEEELRRKALEESAKKYTEEIDRVNELRKRNYTQTQIAKTETKERKPEVEKTISRIKAKTETKERKPEVEKTEKIETPIKPKTEKTSQPKTFTSANKEKLENLKPVTEIKKINVEKDESVEKVKNMINDDTIDTDEAMDRLKILLEEKSKNNEE